MKKVSIKCKSNEIKRKKQQNELYLFAQVAFSYVLGDRGLIAMATSAKEESEIASIKEQVELIKQDLNVKDKAGEARLTRGNLVNSITEELGGIRDSYTSIVNDGRYVVKRS